MPSTPKRFLVDGDIIAYRIACRGESHELDVFDLWEQVEDLCLAWCREANHGEPVEHDEIFVAMSSADKDRPSYRYLYYPDYKNNRKIEKPSLLEDARLCLATQFDAARVPYLEGDDVLGLMQTYMEFGEFKTHVVPTIVSIDKDMFQIPGRHYNPDHDILYERREWEGLYQLCLQWIMGDSTDGYLGIPRMGIKKATAFLEPHLDQQNETFDFRRAADDIMELYEAKGLTGEYARAMFMCAAILSRPMIEHSTHILQPAHLDSLPPSVRAAFGVAG